MMGAGTAMQAYGNYQSAGAVERMAARKRQAASYTASGLNVAADQQIAASQLGAAEARRQGNLANSAVLARAAASGADARSPDVVNLIARNSAETEYRAALAAYQGDEAARQLRTKAGEVTYGAALYSADAADAASAYRSKAITTVLSNAGTMYSKYWTPPKKAAAAAASGFGDAGDSISGHAQNLSFADGTFANE